MITLTEPYIKVGRLKKSVADKAKLKCADIYVDASHIKHIEKVHAKELETVGFSALTFIKAVVGNFNQIRKGTGESYILVVYDEEKTSHYTAAISLFYLKKKGFWEVRTAQPRSTKEVNKKRRIW